MFLVKSIFRWLQQAKTRKTYSLLPHSFCRPWWSLRFRFHLRSWWACTRSTGHSRRSIYSGHRLCTVIDTVKAAASSNGRLDGLVRPYSAETYRIFGPSSWSYTGRCLLFPPPVFGSDRSLRFAIRLRRNQSRWRARPQSTAFPIRSSRSFGWAQSESLCSTDGRFRCMQTAAYQTYNRLSFQSRS